MIPPRTKPGLSVAAAGLLFFLLVSSAPHRVHHGFDDAKSAGCAVLAVTKGCELAPAALAAGLFSALPAGPAHPDTPSWVSHSMPLPFFGRAPPQG